MTDPSTSDDSPTRPKAKARWMLRPVPTPLNPVNVWEHTPLAYYQYGEYPRFLRPPRFEGKTEWVLVNDQRD
jgi:hypothetical protein